MHEADPKWLSQPSLAPVGLSAAMPHVEGVKYERACTPASRTIQKIFWKCGRNRQRQYKSDAVSIEWFQFDRTFLAREVLVLLEKLAEVETCGRLLDRNASLKMQIDKMCAYLWIRC
jgi:hypothetical protein